MKRPCVARDQMKAQGTDMIEYTVPKSEIDKWTAIAGKPAWDVWVKNMAGHGHPEAQDIMNATLDLIKTYNPS